MKPFSSRRSLSIAASPVLLAGLFAGSSFNAEESTAVAVPDLATAQQTTTILTNALVAAVASISDATPPGSTQAEMEAGFAAVSALVPQCQTTYRLIDASGSPLDQRNRPRGRFEANGLLQLLAGAPIVQRTVGGRLRTLVPLTNDMHANCVTCHTGYAAFAPGTVVGAASLRVRL